MLVVSHEATINSVALEPLDIVWVTEQRGEKMSLCKVFRWNGVTLFPLAEVWISDQDLTKLGPAFVNHEIEGFLAL